MMLLGTPGLPLLVLLFLQLAEAITLPDSYNVVWTTQSRNSSESMPLGGGDLGLNVWVENGMQNCMARELL